MTDINKNPQPVNPATGQPVADIPPVNHSADSTLQTVPKCMECDTPLTDSIHVQSFSKQTNDYVATHYSTCKSCGTQNNFVNGCPVYYMKASLNKWYRK